MEALHREMSQLYFLPHFLLQKKPNPEFLIQIFTVQHGIWCVCEVNVCQRRGVVAYWISDLPFTSGSRV